MPAVASRRGRMSGQNQGTQGRRVSIRRRNGFVDGRGTRLAAGRTPLAGAGVPAGSGSRSWCRRRGGRARRWWPPSGSWPGRRRAAPRTAPAAPRSAGPNLGRARSPPDQGIEHKFEGGSGTLRSPTGPLRVWVGRAGVPTRPTWGTAQDSRGLANLEVSGRSERSTWATKVAPADGLLLPVLSRLLPVCCPAAWHLVTKARGRILGSGLTCGSIWWARQGLNL
jgi:hypothetical protein